MSEGGSTPPSTAPNNGQLPWYGTYDPNSLPSTLSFERAPSANNGANSSTLTPGGNGGGVGANNEAAPGGGNGAATDTPADQSPVTGEAAAQTNAGQDDNRNNLTPEYNPLKAEKEGKVREVGNQAVWSLSSCKPGFGVDQLRDDSLETYWQSDGPQPHLVNIQFRKKTAVRDVCIYADYKQDESYTPSRISIRAGNHFNDLQEIEAIDLQEPTGWTFIPLQSILHSNESPLSKPLRTFMVQIAVLSNHQNGRDTHMRQIKIFAPVEGGPVGMSSLAHAAFTTNDFSRYSCIR